MPRIAALLVVVCVCLGARHATARGTEFELRRESPVELRADSFEYEALRKLYVARGSVELIQADRRVRADWLAFSNATGRGVASGNVVFVDGDETLYTEFIEFDVRTLQGVLFEGRFASGAEGFQLSGAEIAKTGERTYRFREGRFTTCRCPDEGRDPWAIRAREADLEVEGYGTARNTTFDVLDVPVVWLPWMIYPLKTRRSTGFLFPEFATSSRSGVEVGLPFFWAAADPVNVTLTPRWLSKRGVKGELEVEYVFGEESEGSVFGSFIHDEEVDPNSVREPFGEERWAALSQQDVFLPGDVRFKADVRLMSDNRYNSDFRELRAYRNDRFLESDSFGSRALGNSGRLGLVASSAYADDLQSPDDVDRDDFLMQRLPRVQISALPAPLRWLSQLAPALDAEYTHFVPRERATAGFNTAVGMLDQVDGVFIDTGIDALPDDRERDPATGAVPGGPDPSLDNFAALANPGGTERNGVFDEGEPLADRGHRIVLRPRIGAPMRAGDYFEVYPEAAWYQTLYQTRARDFEERGLFTGRLDLRTRLRRRFGSGVVHLIEPRLGWALITSAGQSDNPLFVPRTEVPQRRIRHLDLQNVVLDPADRIAEFHGLTWALAHRIYSGGEPGRLLADLVVSGGYDIEESEFSEVFVDGRAYPWSRSTARFNLGYDPEENRLEEALAELAFQVEGEHRLALAYRYLRNVPRFYENFAYARGRWDNFDGEQDRINQGQLAVRLALPWGFFGTYRISYDFEKDLLLQQRGALEYWSRCRCWSVGVGVDDDRDRGVEFAVFYQLVGLGAERDAGRWAGGRPAAGFLDES